MKEKLLYILLNSETEFVSGEQISKDLGCSRTAVWKHIEELRKNGYEVEAVQRKGYRLISRPNMIFAHEIKVGLTTKRIGQSITYEASIPTTQELAHRFAREDAPEGHVVIADKQTAGKGRMGRVWQSPDGTSVSMSIILRPKIAPQHAPQLTLLAAVSVVLAIKKVTGLPLEIKWPNDILYKGKKIVGILTEMQSEPDCIHSVIIGIGMNVNEKVEQFPEEIRDVATSLAIAIGQEVNRAKVVRTVFEELERLYDQYLLEGFTPIKQLWEQFAISLGKRITARTLQGTLHGIAKGITDAGVLLLEDDNGIVHSIYSADIEIN